MSDNEIQHFLNQTLSSNKLLSDCIQNDQYYFHENRKEKTSFQDSISKNKKNFKKYQENEKLKFYQNILARLNLETQNELTEMRDKMQIIHFEKEQSIQKQWFEKCQEIEKRHYEEKQNLLRLIQMTGSFV